MKNKRLEVTIPHIKTIQLSKIKISNQMKNTIPRPYKMNRKYSYYRNTHKFATEIILDKHYVLLDGYTTYLLAKMFGYKKIKVKILK